MTSTNGPKVLIRTLALDSGNYGGVLQAYALQQALISIGLNPATDITVPGYRRAADKASEWLVQRLPAWMFGAPQANDLSNFVTTKLCSDELFQFVDDHIATVELYRMPCGIDRAVLEAFDRFVVGSDQVWRPSYGDVKSYLFDFVDDPHARVISYAASFGTSDFNWFSRRRLAGLKPLAERFVAVSVRERDAVTLCANYWGVDAQHHVDPTMLLPVEHYARLAADATSLQPQCLSYILDESPANQSLTDRACTALGMTETPIVRKPPNYAAWKEQPAHFRRHGVPVWLRAFAEAEFIVTDSYHGTVFAILQNKPFICISNTKRGASRMQSLLATFGLSERLYTSEMDDCTHIIDHHIDWDVVNIEIAARRKAGMAYLTAALVDEQQPNPALTSGCLRADDA
ncbi:polysaccharide pyruvyl transferase family protein [Mycolicibacterium sp. P9-22]|uniref:polysaccharide pyruvyl transferase family protein n=1 Tax=Mycolicibacterium sp. P9-22 TaxID=2024613 RepID=UPI0011EEE8FD|nr:polysaccharide pyruvyl transferase family protein [Mycolicibacterium sp. P9-22]KAA0115729.1 polysaccharide pyruvyl transferase family protein [Mycolicibacterium sp. P9-22]